MLCAFFITVGKSQLIASPPRRAIINQSFDVIEYHFGPHLKETLSQQGGEIWVKRTYSNEGLHQALPELPPQAQLSIIFVDGKAKWILLNPSSESSMPTPDDQAWQAFSYDQEVAFKFFEYILGYPPTTYTPVPGFDGGGHEGFLNYAICLGDGIETTYMKFLFGIGNIRLSYNPACED